MKFFLVLSLIAVASAAHLKPVHLTGELAEVQQIVDAINSPSTDPATAVALEAMLMELLGVGASQPEAINTLPAFIETPVSTNPALLPEVPAIGSPVQTPVITNPSMLPDLTAVGSPIVLTPEIVAPIQAAQVPVAADSSSAPLVQIILNINQASSGVAGGAVNTPVFETPALPELVNIVDQAPEAVNVVNQAPETVNIVDQAPETVNIVDQAPEAVNIVDQAPEAVNVVDLLPETVNIVQPGMPIPVINIPTLN